MRPPGAELGNMCQLNKYICIGYILPTFGGYMTIGGYLCALWALGWGSARLGNMCQLNFIYLYWIYFANIWGIYDSWRVSVHPSTVIYLVWWMSGVVDVRCGGCLVWWMSYFTHGVVDVWCGGCPMWWMSGVVDVWCGECLCGRCRTIPD